VIDRRDARGAGDSERLVFFFDTRRLKVLGVRE
jgi:hypothetical protein